MQLRIENPEQLQLPLHPVTKYSPVLLFRIALSMAGIALRRLSSSVLANTAEAQAIVYSLLMVLYQGNTR